MSISEDKFTELVKAKWKVFRFFGTDFKKYFAWFETPNPLLGGISPNEMIKCGRIQKLVDLINTNLEESEAE